MSIKRSALLSLVLTVSVPVTAAAAASPDLRVTRVSDPPAQVRHGRAIAVTATVRNAGRARAGATTTRFWLAPDPGRASLADRRRGDGQPRTSPRDVLLDGEDRVRPLSTGAVAGEALESGEGDNCRASRKVVVVVGAPGDAAVTVEGLSDVFAPVDESRDEARLDQARATDCSASYPSPRRPFTERSALASIRAFLTRTAGADAMAAFAASPEARSAGAARAATVEAIATGQPGAALAAALRAQQLEPRAAAPLDRIASLAIAVGLPAEGLAVLDAADRRPATLAAPMGVGRHAATLANRATALGMLGRHAGADALAGAALAEEPVLNEAASTQASAKLCTSGARAALPGVRHGRRKNQTPPRLDLSGGRETPLRSLPLPALPVNAVAMNGFYKAEQDRGASEVTDHVARETALERQTKAYEETLMPAGQAYLSEVTRRALAADDTPAAKARDDRVAKESADLHEEIATLFGDFSSTDGKFGGWQDEAASACSGVDPHDACYRREMRARCVPETRMVHQAVLRHVVAARDLLSEDLRAYSRSVSAGAGRLFDPAEHDRLMLFITQRESAYHQVVVGLIQDWTGSLSARADTCLAADEPPAAESPDSADASAAEGLDACPPLIGAISVVIDLGVVKAKSSCESVKLTASLGKGWISAFAEVGYSPRTGKMTIYFGSKGEVSLPGLGKADLKSGIYVTASDKGFEDVGWRVGPGASLSRGPVEVKAFDDKVDISFVSTLQPLFE